MSLGIAQQVGAQRVQAAHHGHPVRHHLLGLRRGLGDPEQARGLAGHGGSQRDGGVHQDSPPLSAFFRLVRFSDWARKGTQRKTSGPRGLPPD